MIWETKMITSSGLLWKFNESDEFMDDRGEIKDDQLKTRGQLNTNVIMLLLMSKCV